MASHLLFAFFICNIVFVSAHKGPTDFHDLLGQHCQSWCGASQACSTVATSAARVGKAGPRGAQGPVGPPGVINMTAIERVIDQKIDAAIGSLHQAADCDEIAMSSPSSRSGVYHTNHSVLGFTEFYCDMKTDGGGWTVIQRRVDGAVNFNRGWYSYKNGFGEKEDEFWLGLEKMHLLTNSSDYELRVDMTKTNGQKLYAKYDDFEVGPESRKYFITVSGYSGNAGDHLGYHNTMPFSTKDADHDTHSINCAANYKGAWWYKDCYRANLNGNYENGNFIWNWRLGYSEMKIRQKE